MKLKKMTTALLLLFVGASVVFLIVKETRSNAKDATPVVQINRALEPAPYVSDNSKSKESPRADPETPGAVAAQSDARGKASAHSRTVVAYYFHGTFRCPTCRKIEAFSQEAVESGFPEDLKAGRLQWRVINVEEPGNEHFAKDYQLYSKAVVLVEKEGSEQTRWKNLQDIWTLVDNKEAFMKYVQAEIRSYLGGA